MLNKATASKKKATSKKASKSSKATKSKKFTSIASKRGASKNDSDYVSEDESDDESDDDTESDASTDAQNMSLKTIMPLCVRNILICLFLNANMSRLSS